MLWSSTIAALLATLVGWLVVIANGSRRKPLGRFRRHHRSAAPCRRGAIAPLHRQFAPVCLLRPRPVRNRGPPASGHRAPTVQACTEVNEKGTGER